MILEVTRPNYNNLVAHDVVRFIADRFPVSLRHCSFKKYILGQNLRQKRQETEKDLIENGMML